VFNVQGAWHPPNTVPTIVHGHAFRIISWQPNREDTAIWHIGTHWAVMWVCPLATCTTTQYTNVRSM